jgi:hypothetical protein
MLYTRRSRSFGSPHSASCLLRLPLQLLEQGGILPAGRDGSHLRIALTHELGIDHEVTHIDVSQEATITIPERHIQLEPDAFALDQMPVGLSSRVAEGPRGSIPR